MVMCLYLNVIKVAAALTGCISQATLKKLRTKGFARNLPKKRMWAECVSFPVISDREHDTNTLASYTITENKWSLGEIKIAERDTSPL